MRFRFAESSALITASEDSCSWAQAQMKRCMSSCDSCGKHQLESLFLPTRLLEISTEEGKRIRLICPAETGLKNIQYTTLCYCWGNDQPVKLTHTTLPVLTSRIEVESLPKTHRDAIEICRCFDVRSIWIDALCILQDD